MKTVRCAIYTRKSSDEGLEQGFNSLDAQREACAAYILSQASEGWTALPDIYDDGGISGGTLERPALQRLLGEIATGRVDTVVVYKVDRLTRSLLDFSKLVEAFDKAGTSFVSITQSFNTTTSMGRLTLNMLLSFAQFEREVTAERIRDKIAASKAKGMWMGGTPPLGYAPDGRSLRIIDEHARLVRGIFERYLDLGNVRHVAAGLQRDGIVSPVRVRAKSGVSFGGVPFSRGQIYSILKSPTYVGEVHHKGHVYPGAHNGIVDRDIWDRVQARLSDNLQGHRAGARPERSSLLAGMLFDAAGGPLVPVHACKGKVRYRYYVSRDLQHGNAKAGMRIPARELEIAITKRVAEMLEDGLSLASAGWLDVQSGDFMLIIDRASAVGKTVAARDPLTVRPLIDRVRIHDGRIEIDCLTAAIADRVGATLSDNAPATFKVTTDVRLTRSGNAMRLVQHNGDAVTERPGQSLIRLVGRARGWWTQLRTGDIDIKRLAEAENVHPSYLSRVLRLAFLSPAVVDAILAGRVRPEVDVSMLLGPGGISPIWAEQRRALLSAVG